MANFINDIRSADKGIGVANMPVVIATAAMDWNYRYSDVETRAVENDRSRRLSGLRRQRGRGG